ncbi:glycine-rich domain-containing protein [Streptomyces diastatochromogenes]|uniref:glycine-rich domain-containing protein n=1 Tax=Streptomyces diastatochromogenes TaxID=42236 RepID=UPI003661696A
MTVTLERPVSATDALTLVAPEVTDRLTHRITADHPEITAETARRIVGQSAAFIAASGQQPGQSLAPSELVDYGWHAFILHTVDYAEFCQRVVGSFVHHVPTDEGEQLTGGPRATRERTLAAITAAGYTVDEDLWPTISNDCSQCHAGCSDSPNSGGKK